jgi:succinoglycan biosynthesis transport protein ExoP
VKPPMYREFTLRDLLQAFRRRKTVFLAVVGSCLVLGALVCIISPKKYEASGTIELETPSGDGLDRDSLMGGVPANADALSSDLAIQTQAKILQSDALALRTIVALHLAKQDSSPKNAPADPATDQSEMKALAGFRSALTVKPIAGTKLVQITFVSRNPDISAAVVNELVRQLTLFSEEQTSNATNEAANALSKELEGLRSQSEGLQKQVASMQSQTGLYEEGTSDGGGGAQAYSAVLAQFQRAAATLSDATQNRILKDSIYRVARTGDPEQISSLAGNSIGGSNAGLANSLGTIESLRVTESQMQTQLDQLRVKFGPDYPKVAELQAGIASAEKSIQAETKRIMERAKTDAAIADQTWQSAQENYNSLKSQADTLNSKTVNYRITLQEADESRTLYTDLLKKLKEAGVLQGLHSTSVAQVDKAIAPRLPAKPTVPLYMAVALVLGIILGSFMVAAAELLDDRILDYVTVEDLGLRISGVVPHLLGGDGITVDNGILAIYHNSIRSIRTNVTGIQSMAAGKIIAIVPATPSENSRQFALSLTGSASQSGQKVLLVEASASRQNVLFLKAGEEAKKLSDSKPVVVDKNGRNLPGICHLSQEITVAGVPIVQDGEKLKMRMEEWRSQYDLIIIDAAAHLFDADAASLCDQADIVLQVATYGVTTKTSLQRSSTLLRQRSGKDSSVIIQGVPVRSVAFTNYYGYSPALNNI